MPGNPSSPASLPRISDELRDFGFSKDCKFNETQVVLALVTTTEGLPVTYRLFPGNIYEGHTLITMVEEIKKVYEVEDILILDLPLGNGLKDSPRHEIPGEEIQYCQYVITQAADHNACAILYPNPIRLIGLIMSGLPRRLSESPFPDHPPRFQLPVTG